MVAMEVSRNTKNNHSAMELPLSGTLAEQMEGKITDGLNSAFESVIASRNEYYQQNPDKIPGPAAVDALIRSSMTQNAAISGGASLIPGPWGMLAVVPELMLVIRNQIALIYDIAAANGRKEVITKELLLGVFISAMGGAAGSLLVLHGSKILVRRASLQVMQKLVALLGGRITQQAIKSAVSKWLPGVGAAAMAAWTGYLTRQIGLKAKEIFKHEIVNDPTTLDVELIPPPPPASSSLATPSSETSDDSLEFYKLQTLIGLARIDGKISEQEEAFISEAIGSDALTESQRERLISSLAGKPVDLDGIERIAANPDAAIGLLSSMIGLAIRDDDFHVTERLYIKRVGERIGFSAADVDELIASSRPNQAQI